MANIRHSRPCSSQGQALRGNGEGGMGMAGMGIFSPRLRNGWHPPGRD
ncbi:MAG: hypothetical protein OXU61_12350 [Gammaproteobacteria bacterium]|nr:hypothetical protein [Gammaproteobacteria bacterium]